MSIDFHKALGVHQDTLRLRAERTRVLASNIANESTPGYQARDIDFTATLQSVLGDGDAADVASGSAELQYRVPYHPTEDGNTVELGVEQAAFSQNASEFQASLSFVGMRLRGLSKAITGQ